VCEPLLTHRKGYDDIKTGVESNSGTKARLGVPQPGDGLRVVLVCPVWRWRELVAGAGTEQENCRLDNDGQLKGKTSVPVEEGGPQGQKPERQSTDARHRADRLVVVMKAL